MKLPRSKTPRFPDSVEEAELVYRRWDRLNGRHYFRADLVLENGQMLVATFDSDTNIAVEVGEFTVPPRLFGAAIRECRIRERRDSPAV